MPDGQEAIPEAFTFVFWTMGDANKDGVIDGKDLELCREHFGKEYAPCDFDLDGKVTIADLSICAKNQGKTIEQEWSNVRAKELSEAQVALEVAIPNNPWYMDWLYEQQKLGNRNLAAYANFLGQFYADQNDSLRAISNFTATLPKAQTEEDKQKIAEDSSFYAKLVESRKTGDYTGMLKVQQDIQATTEKQMREDVDFSNSPMDIWKWLNPQSTINDAHNVGIKLKEGLFTHFLLQTMSDTVLKAASWGKLTALGDSRDFIDKWLGVSGFVTKLQQYEYDFSLYAMLTRFYNTVWTPNIPPYSDLVNMRVKEKISEGEFQNFLMQQGYNQFWSGKIWEAHFDAPSLDDVLTSWRRGVIDEKRVDELMILIDLDPFYKDVFDTRKYVDPSITLARYMFETRAIDEDGVRDIVHRNGFNAKDTEAIVDFIVRFQERRFRLRLITTYMQALYYEVMTPEEFAKEIVSQGYQLNVAIILTKLVDVRKQVAKGKKPFKETKLISIAELKQAFIAGIMGEDGFRDELRDRGYFIGDVEVLTQLLKLQISAEGAAAKPQVLSITELLNAWRYNIITEDNLRIRLQLRGLELEDINVLIATKRAQWLMTPLTPEEEERAKRKFFPD